MCKNCVHTRMTKRKSNRKRNELYRTVSAKSSWFVNFHSKTTSKWRADPLRTRHMTYPSLDDFGYRPQIIFRGVGSDISQFAFKRPVDLPTPRGNILRHLPATTRGLTKNSKNFTSSFTSSKASYCVRSFGILTSDAGNLIKTYYVAQLRYHDLF